MLPAKKYTTADSIVRLSDNLDSLADMEYYHDHAPALVAIKHRFWLGWFKEHHGYRTDREFKIWFKSKFLELPHAYYLHGVFRKRGQQIEVLMRVRRVRFLSPWFILASIAAGAFMVEVLTNSRNLSSTVMTIVGVLVLVMFSVLFFPFRIAMRDQARDFEHMVAKELGLELVNGCNTKDLSK